MHESRLAADENISESPLSSAWSRVMLLRGVILVLFILELNSLNIWYEDISNNYLEYNYEWKVYIKS